MGIVSLIENLLQSNSMVPTLPKRRGLLPDFNFVSSEQCHIPFCKFSDHPSYQTMSTTSAEIRKNTYFTFTNSN